MVLRGLPAFLPRLELLDGAVFFVCRIVVEGPFRLTGKRLARRIGVKVEGPSATRFTPEYGRPAWDCAMMNRFHHDVPEEK